MASRAKKKRATPEPQEHSEKKPESGRSFWSGTITFGLVSIPVEFYTALRATETKLRMVTESGAAVGRRYVCPRDGKAIATEEIVRGFELESGEIVPMSDEELEAVAPEKTRDIDLKSFVPVSELPTLLFVRPYVLAPSGSSTKAYRLLAATMERSGQAGVATLVMRDKAYIVAIVARRGVLLAETLRFFDELRTPAFIGLPEPPEVSSQRTKQFIAAIEKLARKEFDLHAVKDEYRARLEKLVEDKGKHRKDVMRVAGAEPEAPVEMALPIDLVALLKARLAGNGPAQPAKAQPAKAQSPRAPHSKLEEEAKSELYQKAKRLGIEGRSKMTKEDLAKAIDKVAS